VLLASFGIPPGYDANEYRTIAVRERGCAH
jgi:hypothetical protein